MLLFPAISMAQEQRRPPIEIMPFGGFRVGGEFEDSASGRDSDLGESGSFGVALRLGRDFETQWELLYSRQQSDIEAAAPPGASPAVDVNVEYLHLGGTYYPGEYAYSPYVIGGLGLTRFTPKPGDLDDRTDFSLSIGAGMRFPVTARFALRLEGRGFLTFVETDTAIFCRSNGGGACAIQASGSTFLQFEAIVGFAYTFLAPSRQEPSR